MGDFPFADHLFEIGHFCRRMFIRILGRNKLGVGHIKIVDFLANSCERRCPVLHEPDYVKIGNDLELGQGKVWKYLNDLETLKIILRETKGRGWIALNFDISSWMLKPEQSMTRVDGLVAQLEIEFDTITASSRDRELLPALVKSSLETAIERLNARRKRAAKRNHDGCSTSEQMNFVAELAPIMDVNPTIMDVNRNHHGRETGPPLGQEKKPLARTNGHSEADQLGQSIPFGFNEIKDFCDNCKRARPCNGYENKALCDECLNSEIDQRKRSTDSTVGTAFEESSLTGIKVKVGRYQYNSTPQPPQSGDPAFMAIVAEKLRSDRKSRNQESRLLEWTSDAWECLRTACHLECLSDGRDKFAFTPKWVKLISEVPTDTINGFLGDLKLKLSHGRTIRKPGAAVFDELQRAGWRIDPKTRTWRHEPQK
jgi:hypothetical protein